MKPLPSNGRRPMTDQNGAALCISIDLEMAWGRWEQIDDRYIRLAEQADRPIVRRLLELAERYDIPMTWAVVGRIFDDSPGFANLIGPREAWFAPELVEAIQKSPVAHDIGSHSYAHVYYDKLDDVEASLDLGRDVELRKRWGIPARSWVFPRNGVAHVDKLVEAGVEVYRTLDVGWLERVRDIAPRLYPVGNLLDKVLPITPPLVEAPARNRGGNGAVALPSSTILLARNGLRRLVLPGVTRQRWIRAIEDAAREHKVFHPWFHPSAFYFDPEPQFAMFEEVLRFAAGKRDAGALRIRTMADFAGAAS
jgi:peptidoglycan/xylan/chitin deacetylase (PgdA/CDA1 family)